MTMEPGRHSDDEDIHVEADPTTVNPVVGSSRSNVGDPDGLPRFGSGTPLERLQRLIGGYSRNQRIGAGAAVLAVLLVVVVLVRSAGGTEWGTLYTDVAPADGSAIITALDEKGIPHRLANGGSTIQVPQDAVYETRMQLSDTELPTTGKVGYGVLDNQGLATSEFGQRVGFKRAMEGELSKTIESISSVETAVVHLAIPENQVFASQEQKPSASVLIKTRRGGATEDQVRAIVNLVASSIEGLDPSKVTVADSAGNVLAAPGQGVGSADGGGNRQRQTAEFEAAVAKSLNDLLVSVVGPDGARVSVNASLDFDQSTFSKETFEKPENAGGTDPLVLEESKKDETFTGANPKTGGVLGPDTPAVAGTAADSDYSLKEGDVRYALNRAVESTTKAPGSIKQLSVAVLVDQSKIGAGEAEQLTKTLAAGANIRADRGDVLTVTRLPFDDSVAKANKAELDKAEAQRKAEAAQRRGLSPIVLGLGLVVVCAVIAFGRSRRSKSTDVVALAAKAPEGTPALGAAAATMVREAEDFDVVDISAGPEFELGTPSGGDAVLVPVMESLDPLDQARVERDASLSGLIDNQPEEVAALLRGWLADRRGAAR